MNEENDKKEEGFEEEKKKKKKGKHRKKHHKKKDDEDNKENKDNKKSSLSNDQFIINGNYNLIKMLGFGAFGEIHLAYDTSLKVLRAIKFEIATHKNPQLKHEHSILEQLNKSDNNNPVPPEGILGIPKVYLFDRMENKYNYMVMDFLGPSLSDLFQFKEKSFSLETTLMLGIQMLTRIEFIHEKGFIHRDIKPENFVIGLNEKSNVVHIIDFGLSKRYKDKNTGQHIPYRENRHLVGTVRYASINAHLGIEQSRRDDIESIGYVIAYFYLGRLPWQSKLDKGKPPVNKIMEKKLITPPEILCKKMPMEFSYYFHYCKNLKFEDRPDYTTLKCLFADLLASRVNIDEEFIYDWFDDENIYKKKKEKELEGSGKSDNLIEKSDIKEKDEEKEDDEKPPENKNLIDIPEENKNENNEDFVTPGGDNINNNNENNNENKEPISIFAPTKNGDENNNNKMNEYNIDSNNKQIVDKDAENFINNSNNNNEENNANNENSNKPNQSGEVIKLQSVEKGNDGKESVSESESEDTERINKDKKKNGSKKSSDSNYGIIKSSGSSKDKDVAVNVNEGNAGGKQDAELIDDEKN
jgi:serine/threonine protein kinase